MQLPIQVRHQAQTPIYLQIKYQLSYLITSAQLGRGQQLPPVRTVAEQLGVNAGTVAQAYRELHQQGLLEATTGRGTFVAEIVAAEPDTVTRQELLTETIRRALHGAYSLGFHEGEVRQRFETLLATERYPMSIVMAAPSIHIARKYAASLEQRLHPGLTVYPVTFEAIELHDPRVASLLELTYFVVTFARFVRTVEASLAAFHRPSKVIGFGTVVQPATVEALKMLAPGDRLCLVTLESIIDPTLNFIAEHSGRDREEISVCMDGDVEVAKRVFATADRIMHTHTSRAFLDRMGVPADRRLEMVFDATEESLSRLRELLRLDVAAPEPDGWA